jgi:hypothetical protein
MNVHPSAPARQVAVLLMLAAMSYAAAARDVVDIGARSPRLEPLTTRAAIATARFMKDVSGVSAASPDGLVSVSPDGSRYVLRVVRGDAERNGVWIELLVGRLGSLKLAAKPKVVGRLFSSGIGSGVHDIGAHYDTLDHPSPLRWLDNNRIAFLCSNARGIRQVVDVDLTSGEIRFVTDQPTHVIAFDATKNGVVLFNAQAPYAPLPSTDKFRDGYAVPPRTDAYSLFHGDLSGLTLWEKTLDSIWFIREVSQQPARRMTAFGQLSHDNRHRIFLAPNEQLALVNESAINAPASWDRYADPFLLDVLKSRRTPEREVLGRALHQLMVVDPRANSARPLWDAPILGPLYEASWSADSRFVLVGPVFLPSANTTQGGRAGRSIAVVNVATGRYELVPLEVDRYNVAALRWLSLDTVEVFERTSASPRRHRFRRRDGAWSRTEFGLAATPLRFEVREDRNTPPRLFVIDSRSGASAEVFDPNPGLTQRYSLGHVESIAGKLDDGARWDGLLFYPVGHRQGVRYPLVIQSVYGNATDIEKNAFTLYGNADIGLGPAEIAPYAAQVLANRGFAVAHVRVDAPPHTPLEAKVRAAAFEQVARELSRRGLIDLHRVGISGFSRNGYYVEFTLTHSQFPFAAAVAADNWDPSYFPQTLMGYPGGAEEVNGGRSVGEGLQSWLTNAPGFNVDNVRTPLWKVAQTGGRFSVLVGWEMFSRLRMLGKPVEFYVMPDAEEFGSHNTQNPRQIAAVQDGTVDWFDFWLNDREDPNPSKSEQYRRWRILRDERDGGRAAVR